MVFAMFAVCLAALPAAPAAAAAPFPAFAAIDRAPLPILAIDLVTDSGASSSSLDSSSEPESESESEFESESESESEPPTFNFVLRTNTGHGMPSAWMWRQERSGHLNRRALNATALKTWTERMQRDSVVVRTRPSYCECEAGQGF